MKKKLGIIFGGNSVEHEISIITAIQAMENISQYQYEIVPLYITKDDRWYTSEDFFKVDIFKEMEKIPSKYEEVYLTKNQNQVDVIKKQKKIIKNPLITQLDMLFPIVHGTNVEDGTLQGFIETLDIPYAGPSVISGAVGQDKAVMKDILKANDINQIDYIWVTKAQLYDEIGSKVEEKLSYPVILKPAALGSSIGICTAKNSQELEQGLDTAFEFSNKIVIEKMLEDFVEVNISVVGDYASQKLSVIEKVDKNDEILSYEDKYMSGSGSKKGGESEGMASLAREIPAQIDKQIEDQVKKYATETFKVLNAQGVVRIDVMIANNQVYINEVNNIPGSLSFYLWEATGLEYKDLLDEVLEIGIKTYFEKNNTTFSISSNVLNMQGVKGSKGSK